MLPILGSLLFIICTSFREDTHLLGSCNLTGETGTRHNGETMKNSGDREESMVMTSRQVLFRMQSQ